MSRDINKELADLKTAFPNSEISHFKEGGIDFFEIKKVPGQNIEECVLQVGHFLGYDSRVFFPQVVPTKSERNWNNQNVLIRNKTYSAFSYRVADGSLIDLFLGHLGGLN